MHYILFIAASPFLFFLPGYAIMKRWGGKYDAVDRSILSVFLSLTLLYEGIFAVERLTENITVTSVTIVIVGINVLCFVVAFAPVPQILRKMLREFQEKDQ